MDIGISVVIPMYNSGKTIIRAIDSVLNQTRYDLINEIVVVDDGSFDSSFDIVNSIENEKIRIIRQKNMGAAVARNTGIKNSNSEYIALLDSDDVWTKDKIQKQVEIMESDNRINAIGSAIDVYQVDMGEVITDTVRKISVMQYLKKNYPQTSTIIFKKSILERDGYFINGMRYAEEGILFLRLAVKDQLYYTIDPLVNYGYSKPTFGHSGLSGNIKEMHKGILKIHSFALKCNYISLMSYFTLNIYEELKYIRRKIIFYKRKFDKR